MSRMSRRWLAGRATGLLALSIVSLGVLALVGSASAQSGPGSTTAAAPWIENFCFTPGQCIMGDFNGDGREDIAVFFHSNTLPIGNASGKAGDVWVALSNGFGFDYPQLWKEGFCVSNSRICKVGDFDGNKLDDIIEFERGSSSSGRIWVALSNGNSFGDSTTAWRQGFCLNNEICDVGDYNGDGFSDIAAFTRSLYSGRTGEVWVALSTGVNFGDGRRWTTFFCISQEMCGSGDFNGDGRDDVIVFAKSTTQAVYVALSTGHSFDKGDNHKWNNFFCPGQEVCGVADFDGDGKDDIITYLRSSYASNSDPATRKIGYVYVALSDGDHFPNSNLWNDFFCLGTGQGSTGEICGSGNYIDNISQSSYSQVSRTGDYNGDGRADAITFLRSTDLNNKPGWVYVKVSTGGAFVDATPLPPQVWVMSLFTRPYTLQGMEETAVQSQ